MEDFSTPVSDIALPQTPPREFPAGPRSTRSSSIVPLIAAAGTVAAGLVLLVTGGIPFDPQRIGLLPKLVPLPLVEAAHFFGSIAGVLLMVIARGLYRRRQRAWRIAMFLLTIGVVAALARGLDWDAAVVTFVALVVLGLYRRAFYRAEASPIFQLSGRWVVSLIGLLGAAIWFGFFVYAHVDYRQELWWQFAWNGDASRFLRASLAGVVVLGSVSFHSLLMAPPVPQPVEPVPDRVRTLLATSPNAGAQLALTGDKKFLVAPDGAAFIAYADTGRSYIAQGDPVGDRQAGAALIARLCDMADRSGRRCAFNALSPGYLEPCLDRGMSIVKIGEVARVRLADFTLDGPARKDFRYARGRARRENYVFEVVPARLTEPLLQELRRISDAWLALKQGEEKGFALGAFSEDYLANFDVAVLRHGETGQIVAFSNLLIGARRNEISPDLMRYDPLGPSYSMDALFAELLLWAAAQGYTWFSLGAAPFAGLEKRESGTTHNWIGRLLYEHGEKLYHFEGLRTFKQKFDPVWTAQYLASPSGLAVPGILYEINLLISGGFRGLVK